jgi:hypothetical protein
MRIQSSFASPSGIPLSGDWTNATWLDKRYWFFTNVGSGVPMEDRWLGPVIMSFGTDRYDCSFDLPYVAAASDNATLAVAFYPSMESAAIYPDHHIRLIVNGTTAGDLYFDGKTYYSGSVQFAANLLSDSAPNMITVQCVPDTGLPFDLLYIARITLEYPRTWESEGDRLVAHANLAGTHAATGFVLGEPMLYDVTDADFPIRLLGGALSNSGEFAFEAESSHSYAMSSPSALRTPEWVVNEPSNLRSRENAYDFVIITQGNFRNAAETLALHRRAFDGYRVLVTDVANVYDEYSGGRRTPLAIRAFMLDALNGWESPPEAVLLMGDASADTLGYASGVNRNFIPALFFDTAVGYTMSDQRLVTDDSGAPMIAIGRLPVVTAYEAEQVVDKIIAYDLAPSGEWARRIFLAADQPEFGLIESDYHAASEMYAWYVPASFTLERAYYDGSTASLDTVRVEIRGAFESGALIVNFTGHGSYDVWSKDTVFAASDVETLAEQQGQPMVIVSNCLTGAVDYPRYRTLAEALLARERGGAIGVFASGAATGSSGQFYLNSAVYQMLFLGGERRMGELARGGIELARFMFVPDDDLVSFNLFADPMQRLKE